MIDEEATRRREAYRQGGNRRRSERSVRVVASASDLVAATTGDPLFDAGIDRTGDLEGRTTVTTATGVAA
jgi:hypothetical protein